MMQKKRVTFKSGELALEGVLDMPQGQGPFPGVVMCHPHPRGGGDMENNVVMAVSYGLLQRSIAAFRFNFRGVGGSQGNYADGIGERDDAAAAVDFLASQPEIDPGKMGMAGYSFGASVALFVASQDARVKAFAAISGPIRGMDAPQLAKSTKPKLFLTGDMDNFIPVEQFKAEVDRLASPTEARIFYAVDHFWRGAELDLAQAAGDFFARSLSPRGG